MGDRTWVNVYVLGSQKEKAAAIMKEHYAEPGQDDLFSSNGVDLAEMQFQEVNYGDPPFLPYLAKAGIAYESNWGAGDGYTAGTEYCRFNEQGGKIVIQISEGDENPPIAGLLERIDHAHALRQFILQWHKSRTPLPWDKQEEYGKLHQVTRLLVP